MIVQKSLETFCPVLINPTNVMVIGGLTSKTTYSSLTYILSSETMAWVQGPTLMQSNHFLICKDLTILSVASGGSTEVDTSLIILRTLMSFVRGKLL
jgi:hypothetical protein